MMTSRLPDYNFGPLLSEDLDRLYRITGKICVPFAPMSLEEGNGPSTNCMRSVRSSTTEVCSTEDLRIRPVSQCAAVGEWSTLVRSRALRLGAVGASRPMQGLLAVKGTDYGSLPLSVLSKKNTDRYVPLKEAKVIHQYDHRWAKLIFARRSARA